MHYNDIIEMLVSLLSVVVVVGALFLLRRLFSDNTHIKDIIEAEKKRQACPDIQNGMFTRFYTMPYYDELTANNICSYCREHLPEYFCKTFENKVTISETRSGLSGEVRELYITHLRQHNISAVELSDPNELEYNFQNRQTIVRSSIDDKGFSRAIREMIRQFQQQALSRQTK